MDVGLDVVVEEIVPGLLGKLAECESRCRAEVLGLEDTVGEAEGRALEGVRGKAHVG